MIEKIKYNNDFLETDFTQADINMALVDKINEIIGVVNKLDAKMQEIPPAWKLHLNLIGKEHE